MQSEVDFMILDVGLPDMSGFDLCQKIRQTCSVPLLFLTARDSEIDRVLGLELGGDDYVTKPFSPREVCARVRAVLRRSVQQLPSPETQVGETSCGGRLVHDSHAMTISCYGKQLNLTAHEYKLLVALMSQPGRIFTREQLLEKAWEDPGSAMDRTVDAHIKSLRFKMKECVSEGEEIIQTRRGLGYTLDPDAV